MQNSGLATIGLHTHNLHYKKDGMPIFLDDSNIDIFEDDLIKSIDEFEKHLGYTPNYFAYPYGFGSVKTDEVLMDHGIDMIFSLNADIVDSNTKKFYIPRFLINENNQKYAAYWLSQ